LHSRCQGISWFLFPVVVYATLFFFIPKSRQLVPIFLVFLCNLPGQLRFHNCPCFPWCFGGVFHGFDGCLFPRVPRFLLGVIFFLLRCSERLAFFPKRTLLRSGVRRCILELEICCRALSVPPFFNVLFIIFDS